MAPPTNVVRFAPRHTHAYLDCGIYEVLRSDPRLVKVAEALEAEHIYVLGQLVQLSEERISEFDFLDASTREILRNYLIDTTGLNFGMRIPSWSRRVHHLIAGLPF